MLKNGFAPTEMKVIFDIYAFPIIVSESLQEKLFITDGIPNGTEINYTTNSTTEFCNA
jgi:hypothetical protein